MKFFRAVPLLLAVVVAQNPSRSLEFIQTRTLSSIAIIESSLTQSLSGPVQTERACAQLSSLIANTKAQTPSVQAELAIACLQSVPISEQDASKTVEALKKMVQFQSTISYLKNPPKGWPHEKVDLLAGLDDIGKKVKGGYQNEYDFEADIATLFIKAHDGHLGFQGMAFAGAFQWRRASQIALVSASRDGEEIPKVWTLGDFNRTNPNFEPSSVTRINDRAIADFFAEETKKNSYHDPDTQYNSQFFTQPAGAYGQFTTPLFYPGPTTTITYENGTSRNYTNFAVVMERDAWDYITNAKSFYETYIKPDTSSQRLKKRDPMALPHRFEVPREFGFKSVDAIQQGSLPSFYPRPSVASAKSDVLVAGYFITTPQGQIGVLVVQDYTTKDLTGAREFQRLVQRFIAEAKSRNVAKVIIDTRANGGGQVILGYDLYLQFFPSQKPQTQSRWRGHRASELFGRSISSLQTATTSNIALFVSTFSNDAWLNSKLEDLPDWNAMYPPEKFYGDNWTTLLKYNLSDPLQTSITQGIVPTGYGRRSNFTQDPFRAEDLIILSDGICASTCSLFLELMVQQSGVKTIAIGGRPQLGPMVPVGGTKGSLVVTGEVLQALTTIINTNFASTTKEANEWAEFLPTPFGIAAQAAAVNFQDNIRAGLEKEGFPTQFLNDTASCRIWYEPQMYLNVTKLWEKTAAVAFGGSNGGLDRDKCVAGSVTSKEQQTGRSENNPTQGGAGNGAADKKDAAAGLRPCLSAVLLACAFIVLTSSIVSL